ncbi:MAG: nitronate monooxygenase, partial [Chromatiaceae bacterium]|nr:nitronate monooxygenase [Chromatiaceae bacterium]
MLSRPAFRCFSLSPIELAPAGLALATARAGGIGLLDLEYCPADRLEAARRTLGPLLSLVRADQALGLRLRLDQIEPAQASGLLTDLADHAALWLVLAAWSPEDLNDGLERLSATLSQAQLLVEITAAEQLATLPAHPAMAGLIAKGQEAGGWCGEESTFVLVQALLERSELPIHAQGAMGPRTAAACRAAGAAGVVLDDALWLMPESPLPESWKRAIEGCSGQDSLLLGGADGGRALRLLRRPGWQAAEHLRALSEASPDWRDQAVRLLGWEAPERRAWPIGQGVGEAARLRARYHTTGRLVRAILAESEQALEVMRAQPQLRAEGPLARALGTRYPIVQGPMTRVSDRAAFAAAVAEAGALPMVALALLRAETVERLLHDTAAQLGERPWGVGLLGFAPSELLEAQLEVVSRIRPRFALIAGGRPDQAARLEALGIHGWLHVPTPTLARLYIEQGARRLIFEGRECGGHVGPLGSFALWEGAIAALLDAVPERLAPEVQVLFAGGIHDARSARMIEALAAPLTERGITIGVLMGSAYLFTREAVASGAITAAFQREALACTRTVNLETGPGHASRCAITPFVETFAETARALRAEGREAAEISRALDALCLGRLRIAAKGVQREGERLIEVGPEDQRREGMYMIGQIAALRDGLTDMASLHAELCAPPAVALRSEAVDEQPPAPSDIAIIGIGTILPRAETPDAFWHNILHQIDAISEIPPSRWDWRLYYDADPRIRDKVYSKWGCFLDEIPFDPARFGIPPKALPSIDPIQLLSLEAVRRALEDAGYADGDFDRAHSSVILGCSGGLGEL